MKKIVALLALLVSNQVSAGVVLNETFSLASSSPINPYTSTTAGYVNVSPTASYTFTSGQRWKLDDVDTVTNVYGIQGANNISIDLYGNAPGILSTSFETVLGRFYTLSFQVSNNPYGSNTSPFSFILGPLAVIGSVSGVTTSPYNQAFNTFTAGFTAGSTGSASLAFFGRDVPGASGSSGPVLDNVLITDNVVTAVPEPGEWAMMLAGLAAIAYTVKKRKKV